MINHDLAGMALEYFGLQLPTTVAQLKSAYRRESRKLHPDLKENNGGDPVRFSKLTEAYDKLMEKPEVLQSEADIQNPRTEEGILLKDLGIGVEGNGVNCETCDGKGYKTVVETNKWIQCSTCYGMGLVRRLALITGRRDWIRDICPSCRGHRGFVSNKTEYRHYKCGDCDGKGQRALFNPVWAKMRMSR